MQHPEGDAERHPDQESGDEIAFHAQVPEAKFILILALAARAANLGTLGTHYSPLLAGGPAAEPPGVEEAGFASRLDSLGVSLADFELSGLHRSISRLP